MPTAQRARVAAPVEPEDTTPEDTNDDGTPMVGQVDINALIADLQAKADKQAELIAAQQKHLEALLAEKGIPVDSMAAQVLALQQHVAAQANANPWHSESYAPLKSYVDKLESDKITPNKALKAVKLVDALRATHPGHELHYVRQLASDLHTMTLDPEDDED